MLSDVFVFYPMKTLSFCVSSPSPTPPHPTTSCFTCSMPALKETYLQIQERNRREIRNRTKARVDQLAAEQIRNRTKARVDQLAAEDTRNNTSISSNQAVEEESDLATPSPLLCTLPAPLQHAPHAPDCKFVVIVILLFFIFLFQILQLFSK